MSQKVTIEDAPNVGALVLETILSVLDDQSYGDEPSNPIEVYVDRYRDAAESDDWEPSLEELFDLKSRVEAWIRAAAALRKSLDYETASRIGDGGKVVIGPQFFQVKPKTSFGIRKDRGSDFWSLVEYANELIVSETLDLDERERARQAVRALFNPNAVRKGGLRLMNEIGARIIDEETGEIETIFDLYETVVDTENPLDLTSMPVTGKSTPKFVADLPQGEVRYGRGKGTTERPEPKGDEE